MVAVLLPVKAFHRSKHRLAGFLSPPERALLSRAMFDDVWEVLREAVQNKPGLEQLLVVSAEPYVIARCREEGVACLEEAEPSSHSDSVHHATRWAMNRGVTSLLSVPIDTPAMTAAELLSLVELARRYSVVIVPAADGKGTNALLRTPPDAIEPRFGPDSCRLHVEEAERRGLDWIVVRLPGLLTDIDTPEDVEAFLAMERKGHTWELLQQWFDFAHHRWSGSRGKVLAWR